MEAPTSDAPKLPDMVMCGDHPSFTKTELNVKTDPKMDEKDKDTVKEKVISYAKITPSGSRSARCEARAVSEHALRLRTLEVVPRAHVDVQGGGNSALVHAALSSFRWPPYLVLAWVLVLLLTHALHGVVSLLERALPALRKCSQWFRAWTEATWRGEPAGSPRVQPAALALVTALLYALYYALYAVYAVLLWAVEPLGSDPDDTKPSADTEPTVTNYDDDIAK